MKIGLIPLDERPCNEYFPRALAPVAGGEVVTPPPAMLGRKRQPGRCRDIGDWLKENAGQWDGLVVSVETLVYGGLIPSRIGHETLDECKQKLQIIREVKAQYPELPIYAFNIVMRISNSNINEEEPEYWKDYGKKLWRYSRLHYRVHDLGLAEEKEELEDVRAAIPEEYIADYTKRRGRNHEINMAMVDLVAHGVVDFLLFTQDDTSEFGFPNREQRILRDRVAQLGVDDRALIYPGADEVGMVLTARHLLRLHGAVPKFFTRYSSTRGPQITASYEDRPIAESVKGQVFGVGGLIVDSPQDADIVLLLNTPGERQGEAPNQHRDRTADTSARNLLEFVYALNYYNSRGYVTAVADLAYANGADRKLVSLMESQVDLLQLDGFGAWNTAGNTLGTVVAHSSLRFLTAEESDVEKQKAHLNFLLLRFADDWAYQALVRTQLRDEVLPEMELPVLDLGERWREVEKIVEERLRSTMHAFFAKHFKGRALMDGTRVQGLTMEGIRLPWQRIFEVGCEMNINPER